MEISQEIVNLSDICRACLVKTENMKNLLDADEEILQIITKLASIANLEIEINESLPCFLCYNCEEKLRICYDFQQLVHKSHHFIIACVSATSSLKVNNIFKPLKLADPGKSEELSYIDHNPGGLLNFISEDNATTEVQVTYNIEDDLPLENKNIVINEEENITLICSNETDNTNNDKEVAIENNSSICENETFVKPREIERKTKTNQTMRLAQFSTEDVQNLIKKTRERFFRNATCIYCGFLCTCPRSLSVHMTRLHKEQKEKWCVWCNQAFDNLKEHVKIVHKDDFKCPLCGKYSTSTGHFLEHLACHSSERKHICKLCKKCFISPRHLKLHYSIHTNSRKIYSCPDCPKGFMLMKSLKTHLETHLDIHKKHNCRVCKDNFDSIKDFNVHKCVKSKNVEENESNLINSNYTTLNNIKLRQNYCNKCNKNVRSLTTHIEKHHSDVEKEEKALLKALCAYCGKRFKSIAMLNVHSRIHTGEMPYRCSYCDKRTKTRFHLVVHERIHTGEKPHVCKVCGRAFSQSSVLNTHMKLHTGRPEQCSICPKRFCRSSQLRQHMREHTGEKPFLCPHCGQTFKQQSHLVEHIKTHSNERPYQCEFCEKSFKQAWTLKSHINIHLEKKPYKCSQCPYSCRHNYSLKQHMTQHENDQPRPEKSYTCEMCDRRFNTLAMFSSHCMNKHGSVCDSEITTNDLVVNVQDEKIMEDFG